MSEEPRATWEKRFFQRHYSYRDYYQTTTSVLTAEQALALFAQQDPSVFYVFGTAAKMISVDNWPNNCYAREVLLYCSQDAWVRLISINPAYVQEAVLQAFTGVAPTKSQTILEVEMFLPANTYMRFYPTYGYGIVFRADTVAGTLRIWVEGNVEGGE